MLESDLVSAYRQELRRGTSSIACLALLASSPDYGYSLIDRLGQMGFEVEANTLYPLLRRLEKQGLLTAEWDTSESRPRKFYRTSPDGLELVSVLRRDWAALTDALAAIDPHLTNGEGR